MQILEHTLKQLRNLREVTIRPDVGINIIHGKNGQGKTNLIESMWLFTGCHSFRTYKIKELICTGEAFATAQIRFLCQNREQEAVYRISTKSEVQLNGIAKRSPRQMLGEFPAVVFSPDLLRIVKEGPGQRRRFLDIAISQTKPNYAKVLSRYQKVLEQRNAQLRQIATGGAPEDLLEHWDLQLSALGAQVTAYRRSYISQLREAATQVYAGISNEKETLRMHYLCSVGEEEVDTTTAAERFLTLLRTEREADIRKQFTGSGPHKEDLLLYVNSMAARAYASQGQQRSCALALKIAEAQLLFAASGEKPVIFLDDVMSELDEGRQQDMLRYLDGWQVFVTCCEPSTILQMKTGKAFYVENGTVQEE